MQTQLPANWLPICRELFDVAAGLLNKLPPIPNQSKIEYRQKLYCYSLFSRVFSNFHGTSLLISNDLRIEALVLARTTIESYIFLGSLKENESFLKMIDEDSDKREEGLLKAIKKFYQSYDGLQEKENTINEEINVFVKDNSKKSIDLEDLSKSLSRMDLYALYKSLSFSAVHSSKASILMGIKRNNDGSITIGEPQDGGKELQINTALFCSCVAMLAACKDINSLVGHVFPADFLDGMDAKISFARMG
jgi:hypothetical protein